MNPEDLQDIDGYGAVDYGPSPTDGDALEDVMPMGRDAEYTESVLFGETLTEPDPEPETPTAAPAAEVPATVEDDLSYIPEDMRPPTKFKTPDEEVSFYRGKYKEVFKHLGSEDFQKTMLEKYQDILARETEDYEAFKQHWLGFKQNPTEYIKMHLPEYQEALGIPTVPTDEQLAEKIGEEMEQAFGDGWEGLVSSPLALRPGNMEYKARKAFMEAEQKAFKERDQAAVLREEKMRAIVAEKAAAQAPPVQTGPTPEEREELLNKQFEVSKEYFTDRKALEEWIAKHENWQPTAKDLYRATNFDDLVAKAVKEAKEEARKETIAQLTKAGRKAAEEAPVADLEEEETQFSSDTLW